MNKIVIISVCLLMASITMQAGNMLPQGRWEVVQITIEKNTDGKLETSTYNTAAEVKSDFPYSLSPQVWEIKDSQSIVLLYPDGRENSFNCVIEGEQLKITVGSTTLLYQYSMNEGNLILTTMYDYISKRPSGNSEQITEKWTITLKQQK